jgi:phosphoribosyl-ATP pyrophosphohydrolase/phosphoribosyl-AMP cyclohydrolase
MYDLGRTIMTYRKLESSEQVNFSKIIDGETGTEMAPAIMIDRFDLEMGKIACVRMVGFMNKAAVDVTLSSGNVTFYSRTKGKLWQKGESSGNLLRLSEAYIDCDMDTLLFCVEAMGPTCYEGTDSCFQEDNDTI